MLNLIGWDASAAVRSARCRWLWCRPRENSPLLLCDRLEWRTRLCIDDSRPSFSDRRLCFRRRRHWVEGSCRASRECLGRCRGVPFRPRRKTPGVEPCHRHVTTNLRTVLLDHCHACLFRFALFFAFNVGDDSP